MGNISHIGGNVGIETPLPLVPLDVRGGSVRVDSSGSFEQSVAFSTGVGTWARGLYFYDSRATNTLNSVGVTGAVGMYGSGASPSSIFIGHGATPWTGTNSIHLLRNGNVGIGTDAPTVKLDVNGTLKVGDFGGATNVMPKATNAAGTVGQVVPLFTWGGGLGSATIQRNHTAPLPSGTWFVVLNGCGDNNVQSENPTLSMAQTWVVPSGTYLVFAHSNIFTDIASTTASGLAWKLINASDVGLYRTGTNDFPPAQITSANGWNNISKTNGTAQWIHEQNADNAIGGDKSAWGCVYQGGGGWYVTSQVSGYAIRIA